MRAAAEICVVRHGETDWNLQGILQGSRDIPLNDTGRRQALELVAHLKAFDFSGIYSSPLRRAFETATILAAHLALPEPIRHAGMQERHFGTVQGIPKAILAQSHPELHRQILARDPTARFDDDEAPEDFIDRVLIAIREIGARSTGQRVLLITHGWVMDVLTRQASDLPHTARLPIKRKNGETLWLAVSSEQIQEIAPRFTDDRKRAAC